jgi:lysophospholipase L1-like esterase
MFKTKNMAILMVNLVFLILFLAGCNAQVQPTLESLSNVQVTNTATQLQPTQTSIPSATATLIPTQVQLTATPILSVTATPPPSSTATPIPCKPSTAPSPEEEWDYVVIGDSITWGFLELPPTGFAGYLEQDLGIKVRIHNWEKDGWSSGGMLDALRYNLKLRQAVCDAEVVIFEIPRQVFDSPGQDYFSGNPGACGGTDNQNCLRNALALYQEHVDAIMAEIVSLKNPADALIRTFDAHTYWPVAQSKANGTFDGLIYHWQAANNYLLQVATDYQIPVARVYQAFNGPNGDQDPFEKGYVGDDSLHPSTKGKELMADLMRELGYEYALQKP